MSGANKIIITTIRDMSYWLELEKQKNITSMQTLAFASAAHEFRNPLNAIMTSLELLEPLIDHDKGGHYFQIARSCSNLLIFLVKDILDFAQLESESLILNMAVINLEQTIQECVNALSFKAQERGIKLMNTALMGIPRLINTDGNRLMQIIINLLSNAIKYTKQGFVTVETSLDPEKPDSIRIAVEDSGVGMNPAQVAKLFQPYTKIMSNRNLNQEGVGLGLAVSRNIARALGGDITVESEQNRGSRFTLHLPFQSVED